MTTLPNLDVAGAFSIVVQGPLNHANAAALARACTRWRKLFPAAQLICAISSSDCLVDVPPCGGLVRSLRPAAGAGNAQHALTTIGATCDLLVHARAARPLPPMKSDSPGPNNVNRMIAAARVGLALADGEHVLRIRNDMVFRDHAFLAAYAAGLTLPRGSYRLFKQRVLIPEAFTLNPLTLSRMPFHFSDWFHFGLTRDVRALWAAVLPVSQADAAFYHGNPHLPTSNVVERRFHTRLAPEQAVSFPFFAHAFPELTLTRHNDQTSSEQSLLVLADNFVIADLAAIGAELPGYQRVIDAMSPYTRLECMSQTLLAVRARDRQAPARTLYAAEIARTCRYHSLGALLVRRLRRAARRGAADTGMTQSAALAASLSIVLQGPLTPDNHRLVARMCRQWRTLMPSAPVILALSQPYNDRDPAVKLSLDAIHAACDAVVIAQGAPVLPPVKHGLGNNHINLQIGAARAGLERVRTTHVLRIRNDMAFIDARFVDFYLAHRDLPRGPAAVLAERVMISPWFTLNPLTLERLPYHFSDWFHLGRTDDVRALWNVPEMSQADAVYYRRHGFRPGSGARETLFFSRLAAEQHLVTEAYRGLGRPMTLALHNDPTDGAAALALLADDFVVTDFAQAPVMFDKYQHLHDAPDLDLVCVTYADWHALVDAGGRQDVSAIFRAKAARAATLLAAERHRRYGWLRVIGR